MSLVAPHLSPVPTDPSARQRQASDPKISAWVSASAGSGKTTVLTSRVLRLLLDGVAPSKILCLTYTKAAAAEMSIRVMERLSAWATCGDNALSQSLGDLQGHAPLPRQLTNARRLFAQTLASPGGMRIRTIHSFCQDILARFPLEAGVPPHFSVIEESDSRALQQDALNDVLRDETPEIAAALSVLTGALGEQSRLEALRAVMGESAALAASGKRMGVRPFLSLSPDETTASVIHAAVDIANLSPMDLRDAARKLLEGAKSFVERGTQILAWLDASPSERAATFETYCVQYLTTDGAIRKQLAPKPFATKHPDVDPILLREATRLLSIRERLESVALAETNEALLTLGAAIIRRYETRKKNRAALDFNDLITQTRALLNRPGLAPWVLFKLDGGLDHILVDEAQDTSLAQWEIVQALTEEFFAGLGARAANRTLFVVGDEKQSIFSFQKADPEAFAAMKKHFAKRIEEADPEAFADVPLRFSFRSAPIVLQAVDSVFAADRARQGVASEDVRHIAHKTEKRGHIEVWPLVPRPEKADDPETWQPAARYESENDPEVMLAEHIATTIRQWLDRGDILENSDRPIAAGDIMILLRRRGRLANKMVRALKKRHIPVTGVDRMVLTEQLAVMDLLALMQFVLLPEDDLNLATVLKGPFVGLSEEDLMTLAIGRTGTLGQALKKNPSFKIAHDYLARWLDQADFETPFAFLSHVLSTPCPASPISGKQALWGRLGPDALDPIEELLSAAQDFSRRHAPSLQNFLHEVTTTATTIKREMDKGAGQVRIMTVHGSKGLEAPIVFLPDTGDVPKAQDVPKFHWTKDGTPLYLPHQPNAGAARTLWEQARRKQMEEYRRLLYVALTRAENRLYIGGVEPSRADLSESWHRLIVEGLPSTTTEKTPEESPVFPTPLMVLTDSASRTHKDGASSAERARGVETLSFPQRPAWLDQSPAAEPLSLPRVAPSREAVATATPDIAFARGKLIHRLLQSLPDMEDSKRDPAAARFLANPQHHLTTAQQDEMRREVLKLLRHESYAPLFGANSRAEVPLVGASKGRKIIGQVDRLLVTNTDVWIVDYKTNRPPPADPRDIPAAYRQQLSDYADVVRILYPTKTIRSFLLWTYAPRLMEIE